MIIVPCISTINFSPGSSCKRKMRSKSASGKPAMGKDEDKDGVAVLKLEKDAVVETLPNRDVEKRFHPDNGSTSISSSSSSSSSKDPLEYDYRFEKEREKNVEDEMSLNNENDLDNGDDAYTIEFVDENQVSSKPPRCLHVPESGSGKDIIKNYFFNVETEKCERFYYSGEGGNENRFRSLRDCRSICSG